ncbi:MAG: hypothetical protein GY747_14155 [Planctomycetes bacterium]|nr:hypothetical protein [Planctomycetota bacterium]MCP4770602.1 hypothetical protein [Planctomycetota bacterium]MCP4861071.1 hypothetical protein [Planctomycetota bacterium]
MLSALLLATFTTCALPMPQQDPVEFDRLASEQRQVAEQLRRLESLLGVLEQRDRDEGRDERADLLKLAATRLSASEATGDLAAVVEGVAREIASMHSGDALEAQQELIETLQELLDFLIDNERKEREILQMKSLEERAAALEEFIAAQKLLLEQTEELKSKTDGSKSADGKPGEQGEQNENGEQGENESEAETESGEQSESESGEKGENNEGEQNESDPNAEQNSEADQELEQLRQELAELQSELADKLEQFNKEQQRSSGRKSESSEQAQDAAEDAGKELREQSAETSPKSPSEQLEEAIEQQKEALKNLESAKEQTEQQLNQSQKTEREEMLLNVEEEAKAILEKHREITALLDEISVQVGESVVPRSARAKLRQAAKEQQELSEAADKMVLMIDQAGADSFPFYINLLAQDHIRLAKQIGPPRYQVNASALHISNDLTNGWVQLIDAIRTERERIRRQLEEEMKPPNQEGAPEEGEQEKQEKPLVDFALELQLLKRMQGSITEQLLMLHERQIAYQQAGIDMGPEEIAELELLLDRQKSLQLQFESMVDRLSGIEEAAEVEDA